MSKYRFKLQIDAEIDAESPAKGKMVAERMARNFVESFQASQEGKSGHSDFVGEWAADAVGYRVMRPTGKRKTDGKKGGVKADPRQTAIPGTDSTP